MKETTFQRELADAFRGSGWWVMKIADAPGGMSVGPSGRMETRYTIPKAFDLILIAPLSDSGKGAAIECKMEKSPRLKVDERMVTQIRSVQEVSKRSGIGWIAVNFRYERQRTGRVNRAIMVPADSLLDATGNGVMIGDKLTAEDLLAFPYASELRRVTGGWDGQAKLASGWFTVGKHAGA